jgi:hypothetical protein
MAQDFLEMTLEFWRTGELVPKMKEGLIKLIPKKADKRRLKDWRPLTMLNVAYKVIAKLLALRLRLILPLIVAPQQTGFVPGRNILENISLAWLTADWLHQQNESALFLSLDFEKAFDRVEHSYLWETLTWLGLDGTFLCLVKGLIANATSKIHVNGMYSQPIEMQRGVRQGCPVSPLLFAIATQRMMLFLTHGLHLGSLSGIQISAKLTVSFRLFADDMGMFIPATAHAFGQAKEILAVYELASGQKLNLSKSVIVPFGLPEDTQHWVTETGCHISKVGEIQKYLGAPWGVGLSEAQLHTYCLDRISDRLRLWSARMLSFTGRVLLIKHVLQAIPIYHMMFVRTPTKTAT